MDQLDQLEEVNPNRLGKTNTDDIKDKYQFYLCSENGLEGN